MTNICLILCSHGTAVSGIIGAVKGNNFCTVGIAYNVTLNGKISIINLAEHTCRLVCFIKRRLAFHFLV